MKVSDAARVLGSLGGRARSARLSAAEKSIAALGADAHARSLQAARRSNDNLRYAAVARRRSRDGDASAVGCSQAWLPTATLRRVTASPSVDRLRRVLAAAPANVVGAYVFGSVARGTASDRSDVDLAVLLHLPPPSTLEGRMLDYEAELEQTLGRPVQLVILNDAPPDLAHRVLADGVIVLERDRAARIRFEVRTRNAYFDLLPFLSRYRRRALERAGSSS